MSIYQYKAEQLISASIDEVWKFISSPANLKAITPDYMGFDITSDIPIKMYEGLIISYQVKPLWGIKRDWVTEITHVTEQSFFVDEQRVGPYKLWHHQHHIEEVEQGVMMKDIVTYRPPFGYLGRLANSLIIQPKIEEIFTYRKQALEKVFQPPT